MGKVYTFVCMYICAHALKRVIDAKRSRVAINRNIAWLACDSCAGKLLWKWGWKHDKILAVKIFKKCLNVNKNLLKLLKYEQISLKAISPLFIYFCLFAFSCRFWSKEKQNIYKRKIYPQFYSVKSVIN